MHFIFSILIYGFFFFSNSVIQYFGKNRDYSFYIDSQALVSSRSFEKGYLESFTVRNKIDTMQVNYIITVTKVTAGANNIKDESFLLTDYKESFTEQCKCEVTEARKVQYKKTGGVIFNIRIAQKSNNKLGYSVTTIKNNSVYNITFYTSESTLSLYGSEFNTLMNTMEIYK